MIPGVIGLGRYIDRAELGVEIDEDVGEFERGGEVEAEEEEGEEGEDEMVRSFLSVLFRSVGTPAGPIVSA